MPEVTSECKTFSEKVALFERLEKTRDEARRLTDAEIRLMTKESKETFLSENNDALGILIPKIIKAAHNCATSLGAEP